MSLKQERLLVHLDTHSIRFYQFKEGLLNFLYEEYVTFENNFIATESFQTLDNILNRLKDFTNAMNNEHVRLYATGIFQILKPQESVHLINHVYIYHGLYCNIVSPELEQFYLEKSRTIYGHENIIEGLLCQEFRNVVVCGSFKHSINEIDDIIKILHKHNINVLSPTTTKLRPETLGSNFVLFEGQELINERDGWRHQHKHISQFMKSDAVIICNPNGVVGKGALFELGYLAALSKRIIFMERPQNLTLHFPYEVGLNF